MIFETLGLIGGIIITASALPQLWLFFEQGHTEGISQTSNWIGTIGFAMRTIYMYHVTHGDLVALGPYYFGWVTTLVTFYYMYFPRRKKS